VKNATGPISTNKFYANVFLGSQTNTIFTHPYSLSWCKGSGDPPSYGMAISHINADQLALGPTNDSIPGNPVRYFINPIGIESIILSAVELGQSTVLTTDQPLAFSAHVNLQPKANSKAKLTLPLVQGMGYVTGIYENLQPAIESKVFFRNVSAAGSPRAGIFKYRATLEDNKVWLIYVTPNSGTDPKLELVSNRLLRGPTGFSGTVQVAKNPSSNSTESFYDNSSGVYATEGSVNGSVSGTTGTYSLSWKKAGKDANATPLLMFALPHHVQSFDAATRDRKTPISLRTTTKGMASGIIGESWTMTESNLPKDMGFSPWSPDKGSVTELSASALDVIRRVAPGELSQDIPTQTDLDSMYFSGKALSKFATLVYTIHELAGDPSAAAGTLATLKTCFARFVDNKQKYPLVYDEVWKGVVSSGTYKTGDSGLDFGNTYYNDHHFHFGYFVHAAAIIGHLDPSWINPNKEWVNMLIRDAANSVPTDKLFPFSRGFDWYHGHSWAKGLFESLDGKDEESTSEDTMFAYAIKMWGSVIKDASMEARGNLMLKILSRTLDNYFLMNSTNTNQPPQFIGNKVTGIVSILFSRISISGISIWR
jgi:endo-1,3(4)-beta-glucanase